MLGLGLIRMIFMFAVLNAHNSGHIHWPNFISGFSAVKLSFILSGFYMQMIYPKYKNALSFYFSRIIRLYPCYWLVLFFTWYFQKYKKFNFYPLMNSSIKPFFRRWVNFSNKFLFFIDDLFFFRQNAQGKISFINNANRPHLFHYIIDPPAWSLGVEIKFYIFTPILAKLPDSILFSIFIFIYMIRSYGYSVQGRNYDPFSYRFFPYELALFILGQFSYRLYLKSKTFLKTISQYPIILVFLFSFFLWNYESYFSYTGNCYLNFLFAAVLPYMFSISKDSLLDRWLGERVYFIYLWHMFFRLVIPRYFKRTFIVGKKFLIVQFFVCFVFSIIFETYIQMPLNWLIKPKYTKSQEKSPEDKEKEDEGKLLENVDTENDLSKFLNSE